MTDNIGADNSKSTGPLMPYEICVRYAAGELDRAQVVEALSNFEYVPRNRPENPYDSTPYPDPPGSFGEVYAANLAGHIEDDIYDEVFARLAAKAERRKA